MYKAFAFVCFIFCYCILLAQKLGSDTIVLKPAEIVSCNIHAKGIQIIPLDSALLSKNEGQSIAQLLQTHSSLFIKQYGSNQLSTISIRGGSAQQTQIFWSGFNTNNAMLGQLDLSALPISSINHAQLILGAQSTAYGSGAIGGVLSINENKIFKSIPNEIIFNTSIGSYENYAVSLKLKFSQKNFSSQGSFYINDSKNDFEFTNRLKPENGIQKMQHNEGKYFGLTENIQVKLNAKNFLNYNLWWHQQERNIASTLLENKSIAKQYDAFLKNNIAFTHFFDKSKLMLSSALMSDQLNYENGFVSNSRVVSWMNIINLETKIFNGFVWHTKAQYNNITAHFNAYDKQITVLNQYQFTSSLEKLFFKKINTSIAVRYELQNNSSTPFIIQFGSEYVFNKNFTFKINGGNTFRWPTLNDLYWKEGGNLNLKPEYGWQAESGVTHRYAHRNFYSEISSTFFYRNINDWIIWVPGSSFWSPENIAKVESKGFENKIFIQYKKNNFIGYIKFNYDHTLSINKKKRFENDATYNKQLVYTPIQQVLAELGLTYKRSSISFNRKFNGYRYTIADNTNYLEGFWISNVALSQGFKIKKTDASLNFTINNLENKNFEYIAYYPTMGINYKLSITIKIK
jgi:vitamin B12 transporter